MFGASIKNAVQGDQSTIFILEICCDHQEIQVSRPNVSSVTQSPRAGLERVAAVPSCKETSKTRRAAKVRRRREGGREPGRASAPLTAPGLRGGGQFKEVSAGASSQEGRFNGLSFVEECVCAARTRELLCVPHASGWRWGSGEVGANFHCGGGRGA